MEERMMSRSFRLHRGSSIQLGRSNSSALVAESISSESATFIRYERLSQSMRLPDEWSSSSSSRDHQLQHQRKLMKKPLFLVNWIFSRRAQDNRKEQVLRSEQEKKKRKSWYSSWLPDPNQRWPVQGW
ncbi:hypothetical protein FRX31_008507 [Thalictrum thalictroides]|uniref:Uncharacterized protein n=1 Tax=Thalictrum thalictroides TaxID=46969 RepID=A0A7J6WWV0_THATH|nr:hypothetical protein FRX31_008507 [Thalictrum thalictroides]